MPTSDFERACDALQAALAGNFRRDVIEAAARLHPLERALAQLRRGMRTHLWRLGGAHLDLAEIVDALDRAARREGFHVLHDWDGKADAVTPNSIALDMVEYLIAQRGTSPTERAAIAIVIDFYFLYLLALVAMRAWEAGDAGSNLDRVTALVGHLQGPHGSGQRFADNAETLLLIATSHYEPNETGYDLLLSRARALPATNRTAMALTHAQAMGGHLRFGYEVTYGRDLKAMRDDNVADYPWLCFGLAGLMDEYARTAGAGESGAARDRIVEALINGLSPDPDALLVRPPSLLDAHRDEFERFATLFERYRPELVDVFEGHRPRDQGYWPIALFFNFSQNVLKGFVVDALLHGQPGSAGLNDFFSGIPRGGAASDAKVTVSRRLMAYSRAHPDSIRGRLSPVIVYDPIVGRHYFGGAMRKIKQAL